MIFGKSSSKSRQRWNSIHEASAGPRQRTHRPVRFKASLCRAVAAGLLVGAAWAGPARAQAELVRPDPAPGTPLEQAPTMLRLEFNEALRPGSGVVVYGTGF